MFHFGLVSTDLKTEGNIVPGVSSTVLNRALSSKVSITSMLFCVLGWNNFKKYFQWARELVQQVNALAVKTGNLSSIARPHEVGERMNSHKVSCGRRMCALACTYAQISVIINK